MTDQALFEAFINSSPYPVFAKDDAHRWIYANIAFKALAGEVDLVGEDDSLVTHPSCIDRIREAERRVLAGADSLDEETLITGTVLLTVRRPVTLPSGRVIIAGIVLSILDVADTAAGQARESIRKYEAIVARARQPDIERVRTLEERLELARQSESAATKAAHTDPATGLRNRIGFDLDLSAALNNPLAPDRILCVGYLDLDRFKFINDSYGHKIGDTILRAVAKRLVSWPGVRSVGRMGGDEFAILFEHPRVAPHVLVEHISVQRNRIFRSARVHGKLIPVSGSIGLSVHGLDAEDAESLLLNADTALIEAKKLGREQVRLFDAALALRTFRRLTLERDLRKAIAKGDIYPVYQPIVDARTRNIIGAEVLARWSHRALGRIPAQEFISMAVECGLISALDFGLMRKACETFRTIILNGHLDFISFNASALEIVRPGYADEFLGLIRRSGIPAQKVCIEIVESSIIHDLGRARMNIEALKDQGVRIALDDYGTGYSNLRALLDLPIDRIKIDRSIVEDAVEDERARKLIVSVAQLAQVFDAELIAEGVEDETQAAYLEGMNCDYLQGHLFGAAMDASKFQALIAKRRCTAA